MTPYAWLQRWSACFTMAITMAVVLWGCANEPLANVARQRPRLCADGRAWHYAHRADRPSGDVPREGGAVGGTIIEEEENEQDLWLHVINRPLDQDYIPHRPADMDWSRSWLLLGGGGKATIPRQYREWARMTVVGRVTGMQRYETEPVLMLLYVRGWG